MNDNIEKELEDVLDGLDRIESLSRVLKLSCSTTCTEKLKDDDVANIADAITEITKSLSVRVSNQL